MQSGKGVMPVHPFVLTVIPNNLPAMKPFCSCQVMMTESGP